jgi:hypothetical protein
LNKGFTVIKKKKAELAAEFNEKPSPFRHAITCKKENIVVN